MRYVYQQWNGQTFPSQQHLQLFDNFMEYVLAYGQEALEALKEIADDPKQRKIIDEWIEDGMLDKVGVDFRLTPQAINSLQRKALMEVFEQLKGRAAGGHESSDMGRGGERVEGSRPYTFGDPVSELDMAETLRHAVKRHGPSLPLSLHESDFSVHAAESTGTCSTVILLDMSGSMNRWHRFAHAKRCAMALFALIRQRFPTDSVDIVGFATGAEVIQQFKLPLATPKQVSLFDPEVYMRVPMVQLDDAPQHFTNLHMGLMRARQILSRRGGENKQIFIITDGQPTAHVESGEVILQYPPEQETALVTLSEAFSLSKMGIRISTFALVEDYHDMGWVSFVDRLAKLTRGVAFYCASGNLASCVVESYLSGRRRRTFSM